MKTHRGFKTFIALLLSFLLIVTPCEKSNGQVAEAGAVAITVVVLVVGGIAIYVMWSWCKVHLAPAPPQTNGVPQVDPQSRWQKNYWDGRDTNGLLYGFEGEQWGALNPYSCTGSGIFATSTSAQPSYTYSASSNVIVIQYWIDCNNCSGIALGTNNLAGGDQAFIQTGPNSVQMTVGTCTMTYHLGSGSSQLGQWQGLQWFPSMGVTNITDADGDSATFAPSIPCGLTVQKTSGLKRWTTICSNLTTTGTAFQLTITNAGDNALFRSVAFH